MDISAFSIRVLPAMASVEQVSAERVISGGFQISPIANVKESLAESTARSVYEARVSGEPSIRSTFDVYLRENMLIYVEEPCGAEDVRAAFLLHVTPADAGDLPERRKQYNFDNLDFRFKDYGFRSAERCVALRALPDYDFTAIGTGQYITNEDGSYTSLWRGRVRFDD